MASSTSIPTTRMIPNMVIMLIVMPAQDIISIVARNANGIPMAVTRANRKFNTRGNEHITSNSPIAPLLRSTRNRRLMT